MKVSFISINASLNVSTGHPVILFHIKSMQYLAGMLFRQFKIPVIIVAIFCFLSCTKKGNFINEGRTGNGMHYYPVIVNPYFTDTLTKKYLNEKDTTFSQGQEIIFEMDYFSRDEVDSLELWAGKSGGKLKKVLAIPYSPSLYSPAKYIDTVLFKYHIPEGLDPLSKWYIQPRAVTKAGLSSWMNATLTIQ